MRKSLIWIAAGAIGLGALAGGTVMVGCTQDTQTQRPDVSTLKEGINLIDTRDPGVSLSAAYREGTRAIYFETVVGPMKPEVYRNAAPEEPKFEMDMRILDKDGRTFYVRRGGDSFIDPSWEKELRDTYNVKVDMKARAQDFELAAKGAGAIAMALPKDFSDHAFHLSSFAMQLSPAADPHLQSKLEHIKAAANHPDGQIEPYTSWSTGNSVWLETDLYSGQVCWGWICPAWHSATRQWRYDNGWAVAIESCNHGRCYNGSGMGYYCYSNGGWYSGASLTGEGNGGGNTSVSGGCNSPYNWNDGYGQHLCNNDAEYELWQSKSGSTWTPQGDGWSFQYSNGGNYSCYYGSHSGDWNRPNCP